MKTVSIIIISAVCMFSAIALNAGYKLEYVNMDADSNATDISILIEDDGIRLSTPMFDIIINNAQDKLFIVDAKAKRYTAVTYSQLMAMMQGMIEAKQDSSDKDIVFRQCEKRHDYDGKSMLRYKMFDKDMLMMTVYIDDSRKIGGLKEKVSTLANAVNTMPMAGKIFGNIASAYENGIPYAILFYENGNEAGKMELKKYEERDFKSMMLPPSDYSKQE